MGCPKSYEKKGVCLLALALLLAFANTPFALSWDGTVQCVQGTFSVVSDFDGMLLSVVMLVIVLIAITYMLGESFQKQEMKLWAKIEAQNLLISGLLVMGVIGAFGIGCSVLGDVAQGNPFTTIDNYMQKMSNDQGLQIARNLVKGSIEDQLRAVSYIYWSVPVLGGKGIAYRANWRAIAQHKDMVADLQIPLIVSLQVQRVVLMLANQGVLTVLLPLSIVLRTFFLTRDAGNFLIALSFALYLVFPMVYLVSYQAYGKIDTYENAPFPNDADYALGDAMKRIGYLAPAAILIPNLALVITISFTMAASKALRGIGV